MLSRFLVSLSLIAVCTCLQAAPSTTQPSSRPAKSQSGLNRAKVVQYLSACEKAWFNQVYLCRVRGAKYTSLENISNTKLFMHGYKMLAITSLRQIEESLIDSRDNPDQQWRRSREIVMFDGKNRTEWIDHENELLRQSGGREQMLQNPADIYSFYGYLLDCPLSEMIGKADEFYFSPEVETIRGDSCVIANVVFKIDIAGKEQSTRYELALATEGGLFPKMIQRFVDRGEGEKRASAWEALEVEKDEKHNIWHLKNGRFFNLGTESVYEIDILARREIKALQDTLDFFSIQLPADAQMPASAPATRPTKVKKPHLDISFLPKLMNVYPADLQERLNKTYKNGFVPEWGNEVSMPALPQKTGRKVDEQN